MIGSILVVCHANLCRSPLAETLLRHALPRVQVRSAGTHARIGAHAAPLACDVARARGLDLSAHRARALTLGVCAWADLILVMETTQRRHIEARYPLVRGRVFNFAAPGADPPNIADPYGGLPETFAACLDRLECAAAYWRDRIEASAARTS
ncbi:low molecular weight phosphotyrosine protein phosphatase [Burkholderia stagnalis]|uniref:protein-tyrosine-phosphatase n=1 Tax=Burkholderia stagnalis TaxID=1503054 RepID=A0ABX9YEX0_9BURK|nr:low molecular weight phosphotyrosine protein phosphatase [Burkholderia stagnalis]RQQ59052.1 low molecular weight phosphotyrosine protein phosphatase [Burkholderia stagnalis]RQQ59585.1 low molecular weight phosphotyrosine protein phosphatase [Burkholderia stagnalis]RQQ73885.1 low molecular weight phosphotyrosine protein phosphatase [Burkholderia stagnalis]RQQ79672.1 low molecular weight phosphotyrosine protein phosphatase [Burkholderia stagnalis]